MLNKKSWHLIIRTAGNAWFPILSLSLVRSLAAAAAPPINTRERDRVGRSPGFSSASGSLLPFDSVFVSCSFTVTDLICVLIVLEREELRRGALGGRIRLHHQSLPVICRCVWDRVWLSHCSHLPVSFSEVNQDEFCVACLFCWVSLVSAGSQICLFFLAFLFN